MISKNLMIPTIIILLFCGCAERSSDPMNSTSNPYAQVYGHVYLSVNDMPVPNATVSVSCGSNRESKETETDPKGYYSIDIRCPAGSEVELSASSPEVVICIKDSCGNYTGGRGSIKTVVSNAGYAKANIALG